MKNKRFLLIALLLLVGMLVASCGGKTTTEGGSAPSVPVEQTTAAYTVSVVDYKGAVPDVDILVEFHDGENTIMKKADKNGKAVFEKVKGEYTFTLKAAKGEVYYDTAVCVFTAEKTEVTVTLYGQASGSYEIYTSFGKEQEPQPYQAALVTEGATHVTVDRTDRAYYLFTPTRGGIYQFSCISDETLDIGYYGDPHVVLNNKAVEVKDGTFEIEIKNFDANTQGAAALVLGISSETAKDAIWVIERIGDPIKEVEWTYIGAKNPPLEFPKTDGKEGLLADVSVTDATVQLVYNEADGFYHYGEKDGAIVYVYLSEPSKYLSSFTEMCETAMLCKIYYENGVIVKKESYNELFNAYKAIVDANGLCPLTEELKNAIKNVGEHMKWWDFSETGNDIFSKDMNDEDTGINAETIIMENAWMFACCYLKEN